MIKVLIKKLNQKVKIPSYKTTGSSGVDLEAFLENPIQVLVDINVQDINLATIGDDMTQDQREKAQEVVVPVILTRIASMAAFIMRKS